MEKLVEIFDWILRITGLLSLILVTLTIFFNREEYETNIMVKRLRDDKELRDFNIKGIIIYNDSTIPGEKTIFIPQLCKIKNIKVHSLKLKNGKLEKDECLEMYSNIDPSYGILFDIYYAEGVPLRMIEWTCDYGIKGKYIFEENGFNGNVDKIFYCYKYSPIANLRKKFNIK